MKIAYVIETFPAPTEHFVLNEIKELIRSGVDIVIFALRRPLYEHSTSLEEIKVYYAPHPSKFFKPIIGMSSAELIYLIKRPNLKHLRNLLLAKYFASIISVEHVDRIHAHFGFISTDIASLLSQLTDRSFSVTLHANDIYCNNLPALRSKLKAAQFVVTCTAFNEKYLRNKLGPTFSERIKHVYHGIDVSKWTGCKKKTAKLMTLPIKIITVCRLVEKKGLTYLLEAIQILKENSFDVRCSIVGDGPLKEPLQSYCIQNDLHDLVSFKEYQTPLEVKESLFDADIFVLPCITLSDNDRDGIPNALLEAMAANVPVISTSTSGIPELIEHDVNGLLVSPNDSFALAKSIIDLIGNPALARRLAENALETVTTKFNIRNSTTQLLSLFRYND